MCLMLVDVAKSTDIMDAINIVEAPAMSITPTVAPTTTMSAKIPLLVRPEDFLFKIEV